MNRILLLRFCFWIGALIDLLVGVQMLFPTVLGFSSVSASSIGPDLESGLRSGAPLMLGWTALLLWADRKPLERKGVLLLTVFPLLTVWMIIEVLLFLSGDPMYSGILPTLVIQMTLIALFIVGYLTSGPRNEPGGM